MDNKKIGKLIAELRKKKGLTQQELGDKIGVGFRAVSKWECGVTLPDIGNITELSKILGITSDELLTGELSKENKNKEKRKFSSKIIIIITTIIAIIGIITSILIYYNNKTYTYSISNKTDEYNIEGKVVFQGDNLSIIVNQIRFYDEKFLSTIIKNYEYKVDSGKDYIIRQGYIYITDLIAEPIKISEFMNDFTINYSGKVEKKRVDILKDNIEIEFVFLDEFDNEITKQIKASIIN